MRNNLIFPIIVIAFILIIDLYSFKGLRNLSDSINNKFQYFLYSLFWIVPLITISCFLFLLKFREALIQGNKMYLLYYVTGFFLVCYLPKLTFNIFQLVEDIIKIITRLISLPFDDKTVISVTAKKISRQTFISQIGLVISATPFFSIIYGILIGRFDFKIVRQKLAFPNFPKAFNGLKIIQISDLHVGGFGMHNKHKIEEAIKLINKENPDLIFFTGDMVNYKASEIDDWIPILNKLQSNIGKYSILGNHDYGDYVSWKSPEAKRNNLQSLIDKHKEIGFNILLNQSDIIKKNGSEIAIIGVENWGKPPFPQHGNLTKALVGVENKPFKILLSHDPSHWEEKIIGQTDIDLTLSGHTHGMQFAINIGDFKWSPVKLKYSRWTGLYKEGKQFLYVNIGLGYVGYPGRVGTPPEITMFELYNKES